MSDLTLTVITCVLAAIAGVLILAIIYAAMHFDDVSPKNRRANTTK